MKLKAFIILDVKIFNLMRYDSYSRFLKSQLYKDCIVNEMEGKPLLYGNSNEKQIKKPSSSQGILKIFFDDEIKLRTLCAI
jgi:hypothetical protein